MAEAYALFTNQTANGSSSSFTLAEGKRKYIIVSGVTDGCTIDIEINSPNFPSEWVVVDGGSFVDTTGAFVLERINDNDIFRATVSGVGASTDINVEISK